MVASDAAAVLAGLVVFTLGLALFVFPEPVADEAGDRLDTATGHRAMVAVRTAGLVGMSAGAVLVLL